jgi:rhodanese-related sulfurtransferase
MAIVILVSCSIFLFAACLEEESSGSNIEKVDTLYQKSKAQFPDVPEVSADELIKIMKEEDVILVDNREKEERAVSMIPGAISVREFEEDPEKYVRGIVVVYCTIGDRSGHYTKKLRKQKIDAHNLEGGVLSWAHAGGTFVDSQGDATNMVHVYGPKWNLLPEGYEPVW